MSARRALLAKVHIARKELRLDDDTYRAVIQRVTGRDSASLCSDAQLDSLLAEFKRQGFKPKSRRPFSDKPLVQKIYAIWKDMQPMLDDASDTALRGFVRRQTRSAVHPDGVSAPEFLNAPDANRVIEGLKGWRARLQASIPDQVRDAG